MYVEWHKYKHCREMIMGISGLWRHLVSEGKMLDKSCILIMFFISDNNQQPVTITMFSQVCEFCMLKNFFFTKTDYFQEYFFSNNWLNKLPLNILGPRKIFERICFNSVTDWEIEYWGLGTVIFIIFWKKNSGMWLLNDQTYVSINWSLFLLVYQ